MVWVLLKRLGLVCYLTLHCWICTQIYMNNMSSGQKFESHVNPAEDSGLFISLIDWCFFQCSSFVFFPTPRYLLSMVLPPLQLFKKQMWSLELLSRPLKLRFIYQHLNFPSFSTSFTMTIFEHVNTMAPAL